MLCGIAFAVALAVAAGFILVRSDLAWGVGKPVAQPVPFSHAVHAGELGMDCRYCHDAVETEAVAGIPPVGTCMGCHSRVWTAAPAQAPLHASLAAGEPLAWNRVHRLPGHVRFHHGIHVARGVECATCHGLVETMAQTRKVESMSMSWGLDCHRAPEPYLDTRPQERSRTARLDDCSLCHY
ncbi:MAG TPA: cytochrome c3 family protein [Azospirillum sp.]